MRCWTLKRFPLTGASLEEVITAEVDVAAISFVVRKRVDMIENFMDIQREYLDIWTSKHHRGKRTIECKLNMNR